VASTRPSPTIEPGKKTRPVVLVESMSGIILEPRLLLMIGRIAWVDVAATARVASICAAFARRELTR
jgi:hypothetical protein